MSEYSDDSVKSKKSSIIFCWLFECIWLWFWT